MIARFSDRSALIVAFNDLLASGIPASSMQARYGHEETAGVPAERKSFLQRLRERINARQQRNAQRSGQDGDWRPARPRAVEATLEIDPAHNEADVLTSIIRSHGKLLEQDARRRPPAPRPVAIPMVMPRKL